MSDKLVQEALNVLEQTNSPKQHKDKTAVLAFIKQNEITCGETKIPTYLIYHSYIQWAISKGWKKWGYTEFFRTFNKRFKQTRSGKQRYYLLTGPFNLTEEYKIKALKYLTKYTSFNKNEKQKKQ